jgi:hypothetical protein
MLWVGYSTASSRPFRRPAGRFASLVCRKKWQVFLSARLATASRGPPQANGDVHVELDNTVPDGQLRELIGLRAQILLFFYRFHTKFRLPRNSRDLEVWVHVVHSLGNQRPCPAPIQLFH